MIINYMIYKQKMKILGFLYIRNEWNFHTLKIKKTMNEKKTTGEVRRRNANKSERRQNQFYIEKWGITEKQLEEALEQTNSVNEEELRTYLWNHGYLS